MMRNINLTFDKSLLIMLLACQMQIEANATWVFRHGLNDMPPQHAGSAEVWRIAENIESAPSSRESNADTVLDLQKTNVAANVASDKRKENYFVLFALIRVYRDDGEFCPLQMPVFTQLSHDQFSLSVVEGQNRDFPRSHAVEDEVIKKCYQHFRLCLIYLRHLTIRSLSAFVCEEIRIYATHARNR